MKEKPLSACSCTSCIDCRRASFPCQRISDGLSSSSSASPLGRGGAATRRPMSSPSCASSQRGVRSGLTSMPAGSAVVAPAPTMTSFCVGAPARATPTAAHVVSVLALSAVPLRKAKLASVSVHASRRYNALPASMLFTTPVVRSRSCTPLPTMSRASIVYAMRRPLSLKAKSPTLPTLNTVAVPSSCSSRSAPSTRPPPPPNRLPPIPGAPGAGPPPLPPPDGASAPYACRARYVGASPPKAMRRMRSNSRCAPVARFTTRALLWMGRRCWRSRFCSAALGYTRMASHLPSPDSWRPGVPLPKPPAAGTSPTG